MADQQTNLKDAPEPIANVSLREPPATRVRRPNRAIAWFRGWVDEHLSRENVSSIIKTLLWVVPLTLLIWIYAERQQQDKVEITVAVEIVSNDPTKVFSITSPASKNVVVKLRGAKSALEAAKRAFDPLNGNRPAQIPFEGTVTTPRQTIRAERIRDDKRLSDAGIIVDSAKPDEIEFNVDQLIEKDYQVQAADPRGLGTTPKFEPPIVKVRGPKRVLNNSTPLRIEADVAAAMSKVPLSDQVIRLTGVKLNIIGADGAAVTLHPPTVVAEVSPVKAKEALLPAVRIIIAAPKPILDRYVIEVVSGEATIPNVKVAGPEELIDRLMDPTTVTPAAFVELPANISEGEAVDVPLRYDLPAGVVLKDDRKTLRIRVTPR